MRDHPFLFDFYVILAFLIAWEVEVIPRYVRICSYDQETQTKECANYHILVATVWYIGKGIDSLGVVITAIATIVIVYYRFGENSVGQTGISYTVTLKWLGSPDSRFFLLIPDAERREDSVILTPEIASKIT